jgi:hypothetical protein
MSKGNALMYRVAAVTVMRWPKFVSFGPIATVDDLIRSFSSQRCILQLD